jgi:hypothetical protein
MLFAEAVIAEVVGGLFLAYSSVKHLKGSEGVGVAIIVCAFILLAVIPLTRGALAS